MLRYPVPCLPWRGGVRGHRSEDGLAAACAFAGARRRQVAGGVPDAGIAAPDGAPRGTAADRFSRGHTRAGQAGMARILDVRGRRVWDSRGRATVEAEVTVGRGATALACGRAIAPSGASTGSGEAKSVDAAQAVHHINTRIREALRALSVKDQEAVDRRLIELDGTRDKSRLGANALVAVSLACAQAAAAAEKLPLWKHLAA